MATYRNSANGTIRVSSGLLGYPWVEVNAERTVIAKPTADAIMAAVGTDAEIAAEQLALENASESPRTTLIAKLKKVIADAAVEDDDDE